MTPGTPGTPGAPGPQTRTGLVRAVTYPLRLGEVGEDWRSTRFGRLALVNVLSSAGDALVVVALAGSVFVSVPLTAARGRTALGLVCTLLPFAVVAPLIGPAADRTRRGKRFVMFLAAVGRTAAAVMMAAWLHSLLLFPAAFLSLVCSKTHGVARSSLVPGSMDGHLNLVRANSRLAVGAGVSSAVAAAAGGAVYAVFGSRPVLQIDAFVFAVTAATAILVPRPVEPEPGPEPATAPGAPDPARPRLGLSRPALTVTALRGATGFLTALIAFGFRAQSTPVVWYGVAAAAGLAGSLAGSALAPAARRLVRSDGWLVAVPALAVAVAAALVILLGSGQHRLGAAALAASAGLGGSVAKTAFDSLVQSSVTERRRAQAFARFEAQFQGAWVVAALVPTLIAVPLTAGFAIVGVAVAVAGAGLAARLVRSRG